MSSQQLPSRRRSSSIKALIPVTCLLLTVVNLPAGCSVQHPEQKNTAHISQPLLPGKSEEETTPHGEEDPEGRNDWFLFERSYPNDSIPEEARRKAWESQSKGRGAGIETQASSTTWRAIGPAPTNSLFPNLGVQSGRINSIAISPSDPRIVLVGSGTGGIWRSSNRGVSFVPVSDDQVDLAVGSIAFSASNPSIVYAGMGDPKNAYLGNGVLKSTNAGQGWARVSNDTLPTPATVSDIEVDPANPNRVYLAQVSKLDTDGLRHASGFYFSTDGGVSWTRTLEGLVRDLAIDASNSQVLYAGVSSSDQSTTPRAGLYRSTDRGGTWAALYLTPYDLNKTNDVKVAVTRTDPRTIYVLTGGTSAASFDMRVEVSTDGGASWTNRGSNGVDFGQFGYNSYIAADPNTANTVYIGTRDVYKSTDGGGAWTNLTRNFSPGDGSFYFTPLIASSHADQHTLAFSPGSSSEFFLGNDGGISRSTNGGQTFTSLNATLSLAQFISIAIHPNDPRLSYAGSQDNGTQRRFSEVGWAEFLSGDGGRCVINPLDPSISWFTYIRGDIFRFVDNGATYDTSIGGNSKFGEPDFGARIAFYPPFTGNGVDATLYFGTWRLFISTDLGNTFTPSAGNLDLTKGITQSGNDVLNAIGVSRSDTSVIYTGSAQGRAMVTRDGGITWKDVSAGLPNRTIKSIAVEPTNPAMAYLAVSGFYSGHVFKTTDTGATWADISGTLPNIPANALLIDPTIPGVVYVGTDIGVFRSIRGGNGWQLFNDGMPPVVVNAFSSHPTGLIQVATYGRGAYEVVVLAPSIDTVEMQAPKVLAITGSRFGSGAGVIINDVDKSEAIKNASESQIKIKGKPKKLGLKSGDNTIQVIGEGGLLSNVFVWRL
ncbi:MAG TPA: hypothetical protein VGV87_22225 [Blastocatellia bacterium]|nr:hypothetical protein [Blastocatellia bacterium]